ncbi:MAG: YihY/virulence factor BrkB family protein [Candidatus Eremiobacteraeota bacterium]|nr:YihY/virulence factor BrkB family protein [Candidatus Eremiobacteraeota bacterium]
MGSAWAQSARQIVPLAKETFGEFQRHRAQWLAAAIAYFTMFAVAPLVIVTVEIAGFFLGKHQSVLNELYGYLSSSAGPSAAHGVQSIVTATFSQRKAGLIAQIVGWIVFVIAAVGLFGSLQEALNVVWDLKPGKKGLIGAIQTRLLSFGMVLAIGFLLLVSIGLNSALTAANAALVQAGGFVPIVLKLVDFAVSFGIVTGLFALMFEYLPDCRVAWKDVWLGAAVSALLFVAGQFLLGWYLGRAGISSTYGSFGGIVVFLVWAYYSAQIFLFGAEFTHVYATRFGSLRSIGSRGEVIGDSQSYPLRAGSRPNPDRDRAASTRSSVR